ncbi:MAG: exopolysaccharide biosynthesis protein [Acidobacteriaceae bacterium]|nr:exopolysaccharide biosynthesis protein [Acidobacteriaceae bacterium]
MVDIHNHLLPGLDDGAGDLEMSLQMARIAVADGITRMASTPHASSHHVFDPERTAASLAQLRQALEQHTIPLQVVTGCDFHINYDNLQDAIAHPRRYTLNNTEYLLIELPDHAIPPNLDQILYDLRLAGMTPILTHPERNPRLQQDPTPLGNWLRNGILIQVTASSVTGERGKPAQRLAHQMLRDRWVHFLASDAHDVVRRPPGMSQARAWVAAECDADYATLLTETNPAAVLDGLSLSAQPEPRNLYEEENPDLPWWKRLFSR